MNTPAEEAFWNLVAAARAEDGISTAEQRVLNVYVLKLGLEAGRAREIQAAAEAESPPKIRIPKDGRTRLDTLRRVLEVAAADGTIAPKELRLLQALGERCGIPPDSLRRLLAVALRKSAPKLDQAFAALGAAGDVGPELIELPAPTPFGDPCASCGLPFVSKDRYACYCRACVEKRGVRNPRPGRWMLASFCVFALLAGLVVEQKTGLWSLGVRAKHEWEVHRRESHRHDKDRFSGDFLLLPALGLTLIPAWLGSWGVYGLALLAARRKRNR